MRLSRRRFLRRSLELGGAAALGGAFGCAGPVRTEADPALLALPASPAGRAFLGRYPADAAGRALAEAVAAITDMAWLRPGDSVLVKVACNSDNDHPAVTWPGAVEALVPFLRDHGAGRVVVGDQAGVEHVRRTATGRVGSTRDLMAENGLLEATERAGAELVVFDDLPWDAAVRAEVDFESRWGDALWLPPVLAEVDHVVNLVRLGSHALAGYTCALKSVVGWMRDDSRLRLHQKAGAFFELIADANHARPLRDKLRLNLTLGPQALLNIGPDFGSVYDIDGVLALASTRLVDHDLVAVALLDWFERDDTSLFDLYAPYPEDADHWNRGLVEGTWGEAALAGYEQLVPHRFAPGLAYDRCLARMATLEGYRPERIEVVRGGDPLPAPLVGFLGEFDQGRLAVV